MIYILHNWTSKLPVVFLIIFVITSLISSKHHFNSSVNDCQVHVNKAFFEKRSALQPALDKVRGGGATILI